MRAQAAAEAREARGRGCPRPRNDAPRPPPPRGRDRLYLPVSKRQEYLRSSGEKVLASFPVQATIHFYNDESEPDSDEEEPGEGPQPGSLQCQPDSQENEPRGGGRALISPTGGRGSLFGKRQHPQGGPPGGSECSSPE